jgi:hypothetical protein
MYKTNVQNTNHKENKRKQENTLSTGFRSAFSPF